MKNERIQVLNKKSVKKGAYVLYWMSTALRAESNLSLDWAVRKANEQDLPLLVLFCLVDHYPGASYKHFEFLLASLDETVKTLRDKRIASVIAQGDPVEHCLKAAEKAALIVCDYMYLRHQKAWLNAVAQRADCSVHAVESNVIVPVSCASPKEQWSAYTLRRRLHPVLDYFMDYSTEELPVQSSLSVEIPKGPGTEPGSLITAIQARQASRMHEQRFRIAAGRRASLERFDRFLSEKLDHYARDKNDPGLEGTSGMSAALHFGLVSSLEMALSLATQLGFKSFLECRHESAAAFLEELIVRRELAVNFVHYNEAYDCFESLPDWAKKTLHEAADTPREQLYKLSELEQARTDDPYWNAAQNQLVYTASIHGYMRMYWGKRLLAWTSSPEKAWETAIYLNDSYSLDGRDPNGYAGIAWCFGKHDRPWTGRPIYGTVRYMNDKGLRRKFDIDRYVAMVAALKED